MKATVLRWVKHASELITVWFVEWLVIDEWLVAWYDAVEGATVQDGWRHHSIRWRRLWWVLPRRAGRSTRSRSIQLPPPCVSRWRVAATSTPSRAHQPAAGRDRRVSRAGAPRDALRSVPDRLTDTAAAEAGRCAAVDRPAARYTDRLTRHHHDVGGGVHRRTRNCRRTTTAQWTDFPSLKDLTRATTQRLLGRQKHDDWSNSDSWTIFLHYSMFVKFVWTLFFSGLWVRPESTH